MATTSPPGRPLRRRHPPRAVLRRRRRRALFPPRVTRPLAAGALALVVLIVAYLLFAGGGGTTYKLLFAEAGQLVRGDQVQVGGVPVGSVKNIVLTKDYKARITIHVDSSLAPLHEGTTAAGARAVAVERRQPLHRADARPQQRARAAAGATLPTTATHDVVDLDQLFNLFNPKTRKGLQEVLQGIGRTVRRGRSPSSACRSNTSARRWPPPTTSSPSSTRPAGRSRTSSSKRRRRSRRSARAPKALTDLVENANTTFQAVGDEQANLAQGLQRAAGHPAAGQPDVRRTARRRSTR